MASLVVAALPMASQTLNSGYKSLSFSRSETLIPLSISSASVSVSLPTTSPTPPLIYCGRGDRKTAKGKRFNHSFGNARPRNKNKGRGPPRIPVPAVAPKTDVFEDDEVVKIEIDESLEE